MLQCDLFTQMLLRANETQVLLQNNRTMSKCS